MPNPSPLTSPSIVQSIAENANAPTKFWSAHRRPPSHRLRRSGRCGPPRAKPSNHQHRLNITAKTPQESPSLVHRGRRSQSSSPTPAAELHRRFHPLRPLAIAHRRRSSEAAAVAGLSSLRPVAIQASPTLAGHSVSIQEDHKTFFMHPSSHTQALAPHAPSPQELLPLVPPLLSNPVTIGRDSTTFVFPEDPSTFLIFAP